MGRKAKETEMKTLRIILVAVVLLCIGRIGLGFVATGDFVNPIDDVKLLVDSVSDRFSTSSVPTN
jgi:hypothetical protein